MHQSTSTFQTKEIKDGLGRVGLILSDTELKELDLGNVVFLEGLELGQLGSVFILASAVSPVLIDKAKRPIIFQDLPQKILDSKSNYGIPVYCWYYDLSKKHCLYLAFIEGKPALYKLRKV